jgi:hypothetical protein
MTDKNEGILFNLFLVGIFIFVVPMGVEFTFFQAGVALLTALLLFLALNQIEGTVWNMVLVTIVIVLPIWWFMTDMLGDTLLFALSLSFILTIFVWFSINYDQIKVGRGFEEVGQPEKLGLPSHFTALVIVVVYVWLLPLEVDKMGVLMIGIILAIILLGFFNQVGVGLSTPILILFILFPFLVIFYWPEMVLEQIINASLVAGTFGALGGYIVSRLL